MDKLYSFSYENELYKLSITRKYLEILFKLDSATYVYLNRINLEGNISLGNFGLLEQLFNGEYLTSDGLLININYDSYEIKITFLDDGSYLLSKGDGSIELLNNGYLDFFWDDRDFHIKPNVYTNNVFYDFFYDNCSYETKKPFKRISNPAVITGIFEMNETITFFDDFFIGEFIGINNRYNILKDGRDDEILSPLYHNYNKNNLDSLWT